VPTLTKLAQKTAYCLVVHITLYWRQKLNKLMWTEQKLIGN